MLLSIIIWAICLFGFIVCLFNMKNHKKVSTFGLALSIVIAIVPFVNMTLSYEYVDETYKLINDIICKVDNDEYENIESLYSDLATYNYRVDYLEESNLIYSWIPMFYGMGDLDKNNITTENYEIANIGRLVTQ